MRQDVDNQLLTLFIVFAVFQGGTIIRAARRMAEKVGFDPETGRHLEEAPQYKQEDPASLEDGEYRLAEEGHKSLICITKPI